MSFDPGRDVTSCPFCASAAYRIGSSSFSMRCVQNGHQFDYDLAGNPILLTAWPILPFANLRIGPDWPNQ